MTDDATRGPIINCDSESIAAVTWPSALCVAVVFIVLFTSRCTAAGSVEEEKTKQEAIKAGLVQGEYGRWVKPGVTQAVEAR